MIIRIVAVLTTCYFFLAMPSANADNFTQEQQNPLMTNKASLDNNNLDLSEQASDKFYPTYDYCSFYPYMPECYDSYDYGYGYAYPYGGYHRGKWHGRHHGKSWGHHKGKWQGRHHGKSWGRHKGKWQGRHHGKSWGQKDRSFKRGGFSRGGKRGGFRHMGRKR
jgi:hypothetical protein